MAGDRWPNCLGAVKNAGIRCPHRLVVGEENPDGVGGGAAAAGGVLSTLYVLICPIPSIKLGRVLDFTP